MTSYHDSKDYFHGILSHNHWKTSNEVISKSLKLNVEEGSVRQRALHLQAKLLKSNGTVWEALQIRSRFYALASIGNIWHIIDNEGSVLLQRFVDSPISYARMFYFNKCFHIFVAEGAHINYSSYRNLLKADLFTYHYAYEGTLNDEILEIIPIYSSDSKCERVAYLWAVYHSKVVFLSISSVESLIKSLIHYTVPPKARLISAQGCDSVFHRNGLLALHYSLTSKDLRLQLLDSVPAILFHEKPHTDRRRTFETIKFPLAIDEAFRSPYTSSVNLSEDVLFSSITAVVPDSCPNYSSIGEAISSLPFSFTCHICGSRGSISTLFHKSSQYALKTTLLKLNGHQLLDFEVMKHNDKMISVAPVNTMFFYDSEGRQREMNLPDPGLTGRKVTVWEACALMKVSIPVRRAWLVDLWKDAEYSFLSTTEPLKSDARSEYDQIFLLEGVLGLGLNQCLKEAILKREDENYESKYLMEESQKLFEWIIGRGLPELKLPSLRNQLHSLLLPLLFDRIFPFLKERKYLSLANNHRIRANIPLTVKLDLSQLLQLAITNHLLSQALYERKLYFITENLRLPDSEVLIHSLLSDDLESIALIELMMIAYESTLIEELLTLFGVLCDDDCFDLSEVANLSHGFTMSLQQLSSSPASSAPQSMMSPSIVELDGNSLFSGLLQHLPFDYSDRLQEWVRTNSTDLRDNSDIRSQSEKRDNDLSVFFTLPFAIMQKWLRKTLSELFFYKKSLHEMKQLLTNQVIFGKYVLIYFIFMIRSHGKQLSALKMTAPDEIFYHQLSDALNIHLEQIRIIHAFQMVDVGTHEQWVIDTLCLSTSCQFLNQLGLIETLTKKFLHLEWYQDSYRFLQSLLCQNHPFMKSRKGVVAFAISVPSIKTWELHWQHCRSLAEELSPSECLKTTSEITILCCKWCVRMKTDTFNPLGVLLNKDLNYSESEQVISFLFEGVHQELHHKIAPSPTVDALFGFYMKMLRIEDARKLHEAHVSAIGPPSLLSPEALQGINLRNQILKLSSLCPKLSPADYQLVLNINRINHLT